MRQQNTVSSGRSITDDMNYVQFLITSVNQLEELQLEVLQVEVTQSDCQQCQCLSRTVCDVGSETLAIDDHNCMACHCNGISASLSFYSTS